MVSSVAMSSAILSVWSSPNVPFDDNKVVLYSQPDFGHRMIFNEAVLSQSIDCVVAMTRAFELG